MVTENPDIAITVYQDIKRKMPAPEIKKYIYVTSSLTSQIKTNNRNQN